MKSLAEIYDALPPGSADKWLNFLPIYDQWFSPLRDSFVRVLEIGVDRGGSLSMWRQYFGPHADIVGIDIVPGCAPHADPKIAVEIGNQGDVEFLMRVRDKHGPFDIVIDDGSHYNLHQIAAMNVLFDSAEAFYCIEDTHSQFFTGFNSPTLAGILDVAKMHVDLLHGYFTTAGTPEIYGREEWDRIAKDVPRLRKIVTGIHFYDSLLIYEKGLNPPPERRPRP